MTQVLTTVKYELPIIYWNITDKDTTKTPFNTPDVSPYNTPYNTPNTSPRLLKTFSFLEKVGVINTKNSMIVKDTLHIPKPTWKK